MEKVYVIIENVIREDGTLTSCESVHKTMEGAKAHIMFLKRILKYKLYAESSEEAVAVTGWYSVHFRNEKRSGWYDVREIEVKD